MSHVAAYVDNGRLELVVDIYFKAMNEFDGSSYRHYIEELARLIIPLLGSYCCPTAWKIQKARRDSDMLLHGTGAANRLPTKVWDPEVVSALFCKYSG